MNSRKRRIALRAGFAVGVVALLAGVMIATNWWINRVHPLPPPSTQAVGTSTKASVPVSTTTTVPPPTTTTVPHASVTVVVANGTTEPNVASHYTRQLQSQGWSVSPPAGNTVAPVTAVYYAPGQQGSAAVVASELGISPTTVQPLTTAASVPGTAGMDVVVIIGPDLAGQGFPAA